MNRSDIVSRCESRYRDTDNGIYTSAEWVDYVNDALADVYAASPWWPFHETRVTALVAPALTGAVSLPSDTIRVNAVWNQTNRWPLAQIDGRADYLYSVYDPDFTGIPSNYRLLGTTLEIFPRPQEDITLHVDYMVAPPVMISGIQEPAFPEVYHRMLVSGALAYAYEDDGDTEMAGVHRAKFEQYLDRMKQDLLSTRTETYPALTDTW